MGAPGSISGKQAAFIERLLAERLAQLGVKTLAEARERVSLDHLDKRDASTVIERLLAMNPDPDPSMPALVANARRNGTGNRPGPCEACHNMVGSDEGYYFLKDNGGWGVHHKANQCLDYVAPVVVPEAVEGIYDVEGEGTIKLYMTGNQRLGGKRLDARGKWVYSPGAVMIVRQAIAHGTGRLYTAAQAKAHGMQFGRCIVCSLELSTDNSVTMGYGPVCAKKNGWPWTKGEQAAVAS